MICLDTNAVIAAVNLRSQAAQAAGASEWPSIRPLPSAGPRRFGFGSPGRDDDYSRGPRDSGPEGRGRDGDGYGFRGRREFDPPGFGGLRRDGDYGYGGRPGFGPGRDRDYGYGERRGFERRGFGRDGDYGFGERPGLGSGVPDRGDGREFGRGFGREFGGAYGRGRLPWWHPDVGPRRGGPGGGFRTLDESDPGKRGVRASDG
jgi:hypothetical protein